MKNKNAKKLIFFKFIRGYINNGTMELVSKQVSKQQWNWPTLTQQKKFKL
jgi:hypothetical protein